MYKQNSTLSGTNIDHTLYATKKKSKTEFARIIKLMTDMPNTGRQNETHKEKSKCRPTMSDRCPCCKTAEDDMMHLYLYTKHDIKTIVTTSLLTLQDKLQQINVPATIWLTMMYGGQRDLVIPATPPTTPPMMDIPSSPTHMMTKPD